MEKHAEPGTVSHGTMRNQDLLDTFMRFLEEHDRETFDRLCRTIVREGKMTPWFNLTDEQYNSEWMTDFVCNDLWEAMDALSPEEHIFSAHPGNGSDYGYWPNSLFGEEE